MHKTRWFSAFTIGWKWNSERSTSTLCIWGPIRLPSNREQPLMWYSWWGGGRAMRRGSRGGTGGQGSGGSPTINFVIDTSWKLLQICVNFDFDVINRKTFRSKVFLGKLFLKLRSENLATLVKQVIHSNWGMTGRRLKAETRSSKNVNGIVGTKQGSSCDNT